MGMSLVFFFARIVIGNRTAVRIYVRTYVPGISYIQQYYTRMYTYTKICDFLEFFRLYVRAGPAKVLTC